MATSKSLNAFVHDKVVAKQVPAANRKDIVNVFVNSYAGSISAEDDKCITSILSSSYGACMARPLKFLLDHVDAATRERFAYTYLDPRSLACRATATVVVSPLPKDERPSGNKGYYLISIRTTKGEVFPVRFAHQVSAIFYLMYLIDCYHKNSIETTLPILERNEMPFISLYHAVYDNISHDEAISCYKALLYRQVDGHLRVGRRYKVICDIRRTLSDIFKTIDESFLPYVMTAQLPLTLPAHKILFEGDAKNLLYFEF